MALQKFADRIDYNLRKGLFWRSVIGIQIYTFSQDLRPKHKLITKYRSLADLAKLLHTIKTRNFE